MKSHSVTVPDLPPEEAERLSELRDRLKWKMVDLKVKIGDTVNVQQELASFGVYYIKTTEEVRVWTDRIKSAHNGTVKRVSINESSRIRPGQCLMVLEYCPHEMEVNGLCAFCGANMSSISESAASSLSSSDSSGKTTAGSSKHVLFGSQRGGVGRKVVSLRGAALDRLWALNTKHLESRRKLALVLDIDHTFLHSTRDAQAKLVAADPLFSSSTFSFVLDGHRAPYFIKIRPGFRQFLLDVAGAFDIHLYTMSMRKYAEQIVAWIEGQGEGQSASVKSDYKALIQNLVTRDDVPSSKKLLNRLFPCDEGMALIVDDRIDVWPDSMENVLQIHKYLFWPTPSLEAASRSRSTSPPSLRSPGLNPKTKTRTKPTVDISGDGQLGRIEILFARKLKPNRRNEVESALKRFVVSFFANLGCYAVAVERTQCLVLCHRSPDDRQLDRFGPAVHAAIQNAQRQIMSDIEAKANSKTNPNSSSSSNPNVQPLALSVLSGSKIRYKINRNELRRREGDRVLPCLSAVLLRIHREYFRRYDAMKKEKKSADRRPDARQILMDQKHAVFDGLCFVFSGLWALDVRPQTQSPWKRALEFGAKCVETLSLENREGVTHCIAASMGSTKTAIAKTLGIELVHPNWLHNSTTHYMRSDPNIYRPNGFKSPTATAADEAVLGNDIDLAPDPLPPSFTGTDSDRSIRSILKKRKRANNDSDYDIMRSLKRPKTVRFDFNADKVKEPDIDPEKKLMESLTDFVQKFNENKELKFGGAMDGDIVIAPPKESEPETATESEPENENENENEAESATGTDLDSTEKGGVAATSQDDADADDEPFDFEEIEQDIDDAVSRIEYGNGSSLSSTQMVTAMEQKQGTEHWKADEYRKEKELRKESEIRKEPINLYMTKESVPINGDGHYNVESDLNELIDDLEEEQEEFDIENLLDDELDSLSP